MHYFRLQPFTEYPHRHSDMSAATFHFFPTMKMPVQNIRIMTANRSLILCRG